MKRAKLMMAFISMTLLGCPSVHTMRYAEVLPSGTSGSGHPRGYERHPDRCLRRGGGRV